jgi:hypothetical protein
MVDVDQSFEEYKKQTYIIIEMEIRGVCPVPANGKMSVCVTNAF